jgi:hypothetical protein
MKKPVYFLALAAIVGFAACNKSDNPTPPPPPPATAKVMFSNTEINTQNVFVKLNDTLLSGADSLNYLDHSGYVTVSPGSGQIIKFISTTTGVLQESFTASFSADNYYTIFRTGLSSGEDFIITDELSAPAAGKFKIRFVNVCPDMLNLSFALDGSGGSVDVDSNVTYKEATPFYQFTAGAYDVKGGDPTSLATAESLDGQNFQAGKIYTILYSGIGSVSGSSPVSRKITTITNK